MNIDDKAKIWLVSLLHVTLNLFVVILFVIMIVSLSNTGNPFLVLAPSLAVIIMQVYMNICLARLRKALFCDIKKEELK